jgi:hypothetical protein
MNPASESWSWEEGLIAWLKEGPKTEYERVGVVTNVIFSALGKFTTRESWFHGLGYREVTLL